MIKARGSGALGAALDRKGFGERRERLVAELDGEVESALDPGLNLPRYRLCPPAGRARARPRLRPAAAALRLVASRPGRGGECKAAAG